MKPRTELILRCLPFAALLALVLLMECATNTNAADARVFECRDRIECLRDYNARLAEQIEWIVWEDGSRTRIVRDPLKGRPK